MNEIKYRMKLAKMTIEELLEEEDEIYDDCVYFNDCSICPHKFIDWEQYTCKLNAITDYKKMKTRNRGIRK